MTDIVCNEFVPDILIEGCPVDKLDNGELILGERKQQEEDFSFAICDASDSEGEASAQGSISDNEQSGNSQKTRENWIPPNEELQEKIIKQVEFYFSDVNILKDSFLLKHVRRNKQGFVSLKLIASFKKVKNLTKDWQDVTYSLKKSQQLVVNDQGTKVRRKNILPDVDETTPSRTVVAMNLPFESPSIENVAELFATCGEIALVRILRPGKPIPPDIKQHLNKHPEIGTTLCALIEFEKTESAQKAVKELDNKNDWRKMHVIELVTKKKKEKSKENQKECDGLDADKKKRAKKKKNLRVEELVHGQYDSYNSSGSEDSSSPAQRRRTRTNSSSRNTPKTSPMSQRKGKLLTESPKTSPFSSPQISRKNGDQGSSSPWVAKRLLAVQETSLLAQDKSPRVSPLVQRRNEDINQLNGRLTRAEGILRQPKGPDGSPGFYDGKGRGKVRSFTAPL